MRKTLEPTEKHKKRVAIFDIDGTIFRSSLLIELTEALIQDGIFKSSVSRVYAEAYRRWLDRSGPYEKYIAAVVRVYEKNIACVDYGKFLEVAKKVVAFHHKRVYRYTRGLVKDLRRKNYYIVAISNSPREIVEEFCRKIGFDKVYGRVYEVNRAKKFTGKILYLNLISNKAKILRRAVQKRKLTLKGSIGVGDTESDIAFLKIVERPVCFNPNFRLYSHAKIHGWKIVVERKDVVYEIGDGELL